MSEQEEQKRKQLHFQKTHQYCYQYLDLIQQEVNHLYQIIQFPLKEEKIETNIEQIIQSALFCMKQFMSAIQYTQYLFEDENKNIESKSFYFLDFEEFFERNSNSFITTFSQELLKYQKLKKEDGISKNDFQNLLIFFKVIIQENYGQMSQRQGFHHNYKELIENVKAIQNEFFNNDEETSQKIKQLIDYQQIIENYDKEEERINKQNEIERAQHQLIFWAKMINDNSKGDELQLRQFFNQLEEIFQLKIQSQNGQDHQVNIELRSEHMEGITISHERDIEQNKEKIQNEKIIDEIDEIIIDEQQ